MQHADADRSPTFRSVRSGFPLLIALVAVAVTYIGALGGPFVWDDYPLVQDAPAVRTLRPLLEYFTSPFWVESEQSAGVREYYRPLVTLSYAIDFRLHGDNPAGFHLTNLLIHIANTALLFALARRLGARATPSAMLAAAWALLPRLAESVAWISGRTDALAAGFTFVGLWLWTDRRRTLRVMAALAFFLGLLAKEVALAGLAAILAYEFAERPGASTATRSRRAAWVATLVVGGGYAALRLHALRGRESVLDELALAPAERVAAVFEALGRYPVMILDAWRPRTQIGLLGVPDFVYVVVGVAASAGALWLTWRWRGRLDRFGALCAALGVGAVVLVSHLVPIPIHVVAADRFLYLPAGALALALARPLDRWTKTSRWLLPACAGVALTLALTTRARVELWCDEVAFWDDAVRTAPDTNPLPRLQLAGLFYRAGMHEQSLAHYRLASRSLEKIGRFHAAAPVGVANSLAALGQYAESVELLRAVVRQRPRVAKHHYALGLAELRLQRFGPARAALSEALRLYPEYERPRQMLEGLSELEREAKRYTAPDADPFAFARWQSRMGRAREATRAWLGVLRRSEPPSRVLTEATEFVVRFGSPEAARVGYELYVRHVKGPPDSTLQQAFDTRMELVRRLSALAPAR